MRTCILRIEDEQCFTFLLMWCAVMCCAVLCCVSKTHSELFLWVNKVRLLLKDHLYRMMIIEKSVWVLSDSKHAIKKDTSNLDVSTKYISLILFHATCHIEKSIGLQQHSVAVACTCKAKTQFLLVLLLILILSFDSFWNDTQMFLHVL